MGRTPQLRDGNFFPDHVISVYRDRSLDILDVGIETYETSGDAHAGGFGFVWQTTILIPTTVINLPNFDRLPRRETGGMNFPGIKGLDLKVNPFAPPDEQRLVDGFDKCYSIFAGGAFEATEASIKSGGYGVPSPSEMAAICKPRVLNFVSGKRWRSGWSGPNSDGVFLIE